MIVTADLAIEAHDGEKVEVDRLASRIAMLRSPELVADLHDDTELLAKLAAKRLRERFTWLRFAAGKLPFPRVSSGGGALADQRLAVAHENSRNYPDRTAHCRRAASRRSSGRRDRISSAIASRGHSAR